MSIAGRNRSTAWPPVLRVARELFAQRGVQRTSLQDIADRLGITKPALYYHFSSREELGRLGRLLHGPDPTLEQATRAVIAFGGIQDCTIQFADVPRDELRRAAVDGACLALGIEARPSE
jgi:AcrR family transcriptional regulator